MTRYMARRLGRRVTVVFGGLIILLFSGCIDYQEGLFASIEREERIPESNLPKESSVFGMVRASNKYFVSVGKLYERSVSGGDWDSIGPPPGFSDSLAIDIVDVGGTVYVAYNEYELGSSGVFTLDAATNSWSSGNLYTGGLQITDLFSANGQLFAAVLDSGNNYDLLHYTGGTSWTTVIDNRPRIVAGTHVPTAVAGTGIGYVFLSRARVFYNTTLGADDLDTFQEPSTAFAGVFQDNEDFGGILYDSTNDDLYVSSRQGHIYYVDIDGANSWIKSSTDDGRPYTGMKWVPELDGGDGGVAVGIQDLQSTELDTEEGGYYELPFGGVNDIEEPEGNGYGTTEMSETTVIDFFVDTATVPNALFVLTYGQGLWRGEYGNSSGALFADPSWTHE